MVVTSMRMSADIERMGDLARHVAKVARLRYPNSAVPAELRSIILEMGQVAERIVTKAGSVIAARDVEAARQIERDDDAMDDLHRRLFERIASDAWDHPTETTVDITLVGRYYERFGDHAVSVARRVVFLVTGEQGVDNGSSHEDDEDDEAHPETKTP
jgi:phosphate transport system protein